MEIVLLKMLSSDASNRYNLIDDVILRSNRNNPIKNVIF